MSRRNDELASRVECKRTLVRADDQTFGVRMNRRSQIKVELFARRQVRSNVEQFTCCFKHIHGKRRGCEP